MKYKVDSAQYFRRCRRDRMRAQLKAIEGDDSMAALAGRLADWIKRTNIIILQSGR